MLIILAPGERRQEDQFKVIYTESESVLVYIRLNLKERKRKEIAPFEDFISELATVSKTWKHSKAATIE